MKTSNKWLSDIQKKAEKRFAEQKRRKKRIVVVFSSAAGLALILCSVVAVPHLFNTTGIATGEENSGTNPTLDHTDNNSNADSEISVIISPPSEENPSENSNIEDDGKLLFSVNKIANQISAASKYRDPKEHYKEFWTEEQITEYLEIDFTELSPFMPVDSAYSQRGDFRILFHNSGEVIEDYQAFYYEGENNRKVKVSVSKIATPYDCLYELETDEKTFVGNTEVLFGVKPNSQDASQYDFCYADFEDGGLYYRVEADNLTSREFYKIVEGITQLK